MVTWYQFAKNFLNFGLGIVAVSTISLAAALGTQLSAPLVGLLGRLRRFRMPKGPMPAHWAEMITSRVPLAKDLTNEEFDRLQRLIAVFLRDVPMDGCNDLVLTENMRIVIAAQACLPILNLPFPWYPKVKHVLVYPDAFAPRATRLEPSGSIPKAPPPTAGQAYLHGTVILSWQSAETGITDAKDGYNPIIHEFAHLLDAEDGAFDGIPVLEPPSNYARWTQVFQLHYGGLVKRHRKKKKNKASLRPYGSTNRAEHFAVAVESFFEKPTYLRERSPALYAELVAYFRQDPAARRQTNAV